MGSWGGVGEVSAVREMESVGAVRLSGGFWLLLLLLLLLGGYEARRRTKIFWSLFVGMLIVFCFLSFYLIVLLGFREGGAVLVWIGSLWAMEIGVEIWGERQWGRARGRAR